MHLSRWNHPKNGSPRLYISATFLKRFPGLDPKETKIWLEPSRKAKSGWQVQLKGDSSAIATTDEEAKALVLMNLGIDPAVSWVSLLELADADKPRPAMPSYGAQGVPGPDTSSARAIEAAKLSVASIKMPGAVVIYIDHREPEALTELLATNSLILVERTTLPLGDVMVEDREGNVLLIERKRCDDSAIKTDFEASIQTGGRLFDQSERMKLAESLGERQVIPVFLLEGDLYRNAASMLCQHIDGALSFLAAVQRVSVLPTLGLNHTAYLIAKLASHFMDGLYTPVTLHQAKPQELFAQQRYVLEALPGVSSKIADALLERFGSVRGVMTASETDLLAVPGLGKKKVAEMLKAIAAPE